MPTGNLEVIGSRKFGVEIELTALDSAAFGRDMVRYQIPYVAGGASGSTRTTPTTWILKHDGSVSGQQLELVSHPRSGIRGLAEVKFVLDLVKANGGAVDPSCGIHVHHEAADFENKHLREALILQSKYQDLLYGICHPSRKTNRYCIPWTDAEVSDILGTYSATGTRFKEKLFQYERYHGLNFQSLNVHGTLEYRMLEGTLDVSKITAWIILTHKKVRTARHRPGEAIMRKVSPNQVQLLGANFGMLARNGNEVHPDVPPLFNCLSSYYHLYKRMRENGGRDAAGRPVLGE